MLGPDGLPRCPWGAGGEEYGVYHDAEWGRPVTDETGLLERLCLEGFQSGLSWLTVLRKRAGFRAAFAGFDPAAVAAFGPADVERLLADPRIVRHRGKIEAAIANARATLALAEAGTSLAALVWGSEPDPPPPPPRAMADLPAVTPESIALARELRRRGFRFLGPTTVYAALQAVGVVNDHLEGCHFREMIEQAKQATLRPGR